MKKMKFYEEMIGVIYQNEGKVIFLHDKFLRRSLEFLLVSLNTNLLVGIVKINGFRREDCGIQKLFIKLRGRN